MAVVACNTATAAAIDALRGENPGFPIVGMEPAVKPAAAATKTGVVGVLATAGTFKGRLYNSTRAKYAAGVKVVETVADELVRLAESGETRTERAAQAVRTAVEPLLAAGCDKIVLGCTHFTHLAGLIAETCAGRAEIVDSCEAVARRASNLLDSLGIAAPGSAAPRHAVFSTLETGKEHPGNAATPR